MYRLILILSLLPIAIALLSRWWFGLRVLATEGKHTCHCDLARWMPAPGDDSSLHRAENSAAEFGRELRLKALAEWHARDPKAAKAREGTRRFGMAVPPLGGVVAIMGMLVGRIPAIGAIAILLGASAFAAAFSLLSLPAELRAIASSARGIRENKSFPAQSDERAVIECAMAHAWDAALPPILRWLQR
jgi:hypothetical protein